LLVTLKLRSLKILAVSLVSLASLGHLPGESFGAGEGSGAPGVVSLKPDAPVQAPPGEVLARVNGMTITRTEVDRAIVIFLAQSRASHDLSPETRKEAEAAALEQLIGAKLLYQKGIEQKMEGLDQLVSEKIAQSKAKFPSSAAYVAALKASNLTEAEAGEIVRRDAVVTHFLERQVVAKITVSDQDIRTFYQQNLDKFSLPESVQISHILIEAGAQATAQEKLKGRERAEGIRKILVAGEDFAALAKTDSSCPSKEEGGDLGVFGKDELIPEFDAAVANLKPGEISQVVETGFGFHVLKVVARKSASVRTVDEARDQIEPYLKQTRAQQAIVDYVGELKKGASIEMAAAKAL
jgi:peptidyl-prolyl cis-trans isomerase C